MVSVKHALIDLPMTEDVARYVAMLERKVLALTISDLKMRCLLELLTDTMWDDERFTAEDNEIRRIAEQVLVKRLGLSVQDAKKLIDQRWTKYQGPIEISTAHGTQHLADEISDRPIPERNLPRLTGARALDPAQPFDVRAALAGYKQRRQLQRDMIEPDKISLDLKPEELPE